MTCVSQKIREISLLPNLSAITDNAFASPENGSGKEMSSLYFRRVRTIIYPQLLICGWEEPHAITLRAGVIFHWRIPPRLGFKPK
jgi:hypothetical protein